MGNLSSPGSPTSANDQAPVQTLPNDQAPVQTLPNDQWCHRLGRQDYDTVADPTAC